VATERTRRRRGQDALPAVDHSRLATATEDSPPASGTAAEPGVSSPEPGPVEGAPFPPEPAPEDRGVARYSRPVPSRRATPIGRLPSRGKVTVEGRVHAVEIRPVERNTVLACEIADATGQLTAMFYGRSHIPGLDPGAKVRFTGQVGVRDKEAVMINPAYELLAPGSGDSPAL
jgi:hypothetical protein